VVVNATGVAYVGDWGLTTLYHTANAPFTHDDSFFGQEIIGGPMLSACVLSKEAGAHGCREEARSSFYRPALLGSR
jgi:hypothetical protein